MNWGLLIEGILAALLLVTIAYASILNTKLSVLRDAKDEMEALIKEFAEAADLANRGVSELKERALVSGTELEQQVKQANENLEKARSLTDELSYLVERGESLAGRLDQGISANRAPKSAGSGSKAASLTKGSRGARGAVQTAGRTAARETDPDDPESGAKSALLKSLESLR